MENVKLQKRPMVHSVTDYKITVRAPILKFSEIVLYNASNNW